MPFNYSIENILNGTTLVNTTQPDSETLAITTRPLSTFKLLLFLFLLTTIGCVLICRRHWDTSENQTVLNTPYIASISLTLTPVVL